jgi:hypothetical protein
MVTAGTGAAAPATPDPLPLVLVPVLEIELQGEVVDLDVDHAGHLLILDADGPEVEVRSSEGRRLDRWALTGYTDPPFLRPTALALTGLGILILDSGERVVLRFDLRGEYEGRVVDLDLHTDADRRRFFEPADFAADGAGRTFLTDRDGHRVVVIDAYGEPRGSFGGYGEGLGQLRSPGDVAVDESGLVWVADTGNRRVQRFDSFGAPLGVVTLPGDPHPVPVTLAPLLGGRLVVVDDAGILHIVSAAGRPLGRAEVGLVRRVAVGPDDRVALFLPGTTPRLRILRIEPADAATSP